MPRSKDQADATVDPASDAWKKMFAGMPGISPQNAFQLYSAILEGMGEVGRELSEFVARRLAEDIATQRAIMGSSSPAELLHIQRHFLQRAVEQYMDETGKLTNLGAEIAAKVSGRSS